MKVKELGEFEVINLLAEMVTRERRGPDRGSFGDFQLLVDVGDDTAAWTPGRATELHTTDTMVEGVHFTWGTVSWYHLGWKIMAANISDIAAMGGLPLYALVTLGVPLDTEVEELESLYRGMLDLGSEYGLAIVGGDIVRSPVVFVTLSLTGACEGAPMLRSNAGQGDVVAVTGYLGSSAGGLDILMKGLPVQREAGDYLKAAHQKPQPCISQGRILSQNGVRTAIDVSDGLVDDLSKLCRASGVAARIEAPRVPVHTTLKEAIPQGYMDIALAGGEDYQLLFTAPAELIHRVLPMLGPPAAPIGEIVEGESGQVTVVGETTGETMEVQRKGWDHFA